LIAVERLATEPRTATAAELLLKPEVARHVPADLSTSEAPEQSLEQPGNPTRTGRL